MNRANLIKAAADAITGQGSDPQHLATLAVDAILAELPRPTGFWKVTHNDDPPMTTQEPTEFKPCVMKTAHFNDTEMVLQDCLTIWDRWDAKTEVGVNESGLLVAVKLIGYAHNNDPPLPDHVEGYLQETMGAEEVREPKNGDGK